MIVEILITIALVLILLNMFYKPNMVKDLTVQKQKSPSLLAKYKLRKSREVGRLPPVYPNGWFALMESSELKKGQVKYIAALGQNFAVFRTESGKARILHAYCPHLGSNLAEGGQVVGEELQCPFHSWRFCGETGKCTDIPYSKHVPAGIKTKAWDSCEVNGIIFVWHHAESNPPNWRPEPIEQINNGAWQYQGRNEFFFYCHIQDIPENGADFAHFSTVHKPALLFDKIISKFAHHGWSNANWREKTSVPENELQDILKQERTSKHEAISQLTHSLILFKKYSFLEMDVVARQIGPGYVELYLQTSLGPMCILQTVTPLKPLLQRVTHQMFAPSLIGWYSKFVLWAETLMFERDVLVWANKKYLDKPILVSEDKAIKAYRRWYKQFYSEKSPTYESCRNTIEW